MNIQQLINSGESGVSITVTLADLREFALDLINQTAGRIADELTQHTNNTTTRKAPATDPDMMETDEVLDRLQVNRSTLFRWNNNGYLCHVKVGRRNLYRRADVLRILGE